MGVEYLKETHPLKDTVEWRHVNPCFVCCGRKKDGGSKDGKRKEERMGMIVKSSEQINKEMEDESEGEEADTVISQRINPYLAAGYGVNAYFDI